MDNLQAVNTSENNKRIAKNTMLFIYAYVTLDASEFIHESNKS